MRRMIAELPVEEMDRLGYGRLFEMAEVQYIYGLRYGSRGFVELVKFRMRDPQVEPKAIADGKHIVRVEVQNRSDGWLTCLLHRAPRKLFWNHLSPWVFQDHSLEVHGKWVRISMLGGPDELHALTKAAEAEGIRYRVQRVEEVEVGPASPLGGLTRQQRRVLRAAYDLGYFEQPKRVYAEDLARALGLKKATVVEHLRKAEKRLLDTMFR